MKSVMLAMLLLFSSSSHSAWLHLGSSSGDGGFDVYTDPDTLIQSGDTAMMWGRIDYKSPLKTAFGKPYLSIQRRSEYA
ncbi:MAG: surface-adhesin E family protein, partial [Burkholderiales bacterium]